MRFVAGILTALALVGLSGSAAAEHGTPGTTQLISRPTGTGPMIPGQNAGRTGSNRVVSADGRYVVFASSSDGLSTEDDNHALNVFVRDTQTGVATFVSRASGAHGAPSHLYAAAPTISADGKRVAFTTASSLDPLDTNTHLDVYVRDLTTNTTFLVSRTGGATDVVGNSDSTAPSIDSDGNRVAFASTATNFPSGGTDGLSQVYVHDISANTTELVSRRANPFQVGDKLSDEPSISGDGKKVAFESLATNLDADPSHSDSNNAYDIYWRDISGNVTTVISAKDNATGPNASTNPSISGDGVKVAFQSFVKTFDPAAASGTTEDVYVRNLTETTPTLASRADGPTGAEGSLYSFNPSLNYDGTKVAFESESSNLGPPDANQTSDVYVRDLSADTTKLASRAPGASGAVGNSFSGYPSINGNGTRVAFETLATNFGSSPGPDQGQVYLRDLSANTNTFISRPSGSAPFVVDDGASYLGSFTNATSADGRFVVFTSAADRLSTADDNRYYNTFLRDTLLDTTTLVSRVGAAGPGANGYSSQEVISGDGTTVAFVSGATNLVPGDVNGHDDVFVRTLATGATVRVGGPTHGADSPALSANGKIVAFVSADPLAPGVPPNPPRQVYVRNLTTGATTLVSRAKGPSGAAGDNATGYPTISSDGTKVAFMSAAVNLIDGGAPAYQVYVRDLRANTTTLVSRASTATGAIANQQADLAAISGDGTAVSFHSRAANLVPGDANMVGDVFVRNLVTDTTMLVSRPNGSTTAEGNNDSGINSLSDDGKRITFASYSTNLVPGDTKFDADVFLRDLVTNKTTLVTVSLAGKPAGGDGESLSAAISGNGDCVVFSSTGDDLAAAAPQSDFARVYLRTVSRECPAVPPETTIASGPRKRSAKRRPVFTFSASEAGTFQCKLGASAFASCATPFTVLRLADGAHTFQVRATDLAGYVDATPATQTWTVDATGPRIRITVPKQRLASVRKRGLKVIVRCNEICTLGSTVFDGRKVAGKRTVVLKRGRKKTFRIKLTRKEKRHLKGVKAVRLRLRASARDDLGNKSRVTVKRFKLR